ncbi:MAG: hypothetical protein U0350_43820 [Caldilineaceae bacterium]
MTGNFFLDWALMAVSLINVILLTWLGLTVLLNAERRNWGAGWLVGGGILMGGVFFICHTAILGLGPDFVNYGLEWWWRAGWLPLVALPVTWYLLVLWYTGFWDQLLKMTAHPADRGKLRWPRLLYAGPRHLLWLGCTLLLFLALVGLLLFTSPLPSFSAAAQLQLSAPLAIDGLPVLLLLFPIYIVLCIGLSLDALRHPQPSVRMMGDQARRRAHPWLMAAGSLLFLISLLVGGVILWVMLNAERISLGNDYWVMSMAIAWLDLLIAGLITLVIYLIGQAIVAYEIFTGKTLPRGELRRAWLNAIILALGFGVLVGLSFALHLRPIYSLLLATILMIFFYALLSWRSYARREEYLRQLRPFLGSQHLYEQLLQTPHHGVAPAQLQANLASPQAPPETDIATPFYALCHDILNVRYAYLVPLGPLAPLVGPPLAYPSQVATPLPDLTHLIKTLHPPQTICLPLDPTEMAGLHWAVSLWSERGLIGLFLLGPKRDNGLYTQEDIEIARASGERLIDTRASAELARSLMTLQRQRLTESQLLDRRTRRVLHDEILPQVHTALLTLSENSATSVADASTLLIDVHQQISALLREMPARPAPALAGLGLAPALRQLLVDELPEAFERVDWQIEPAAEQLLQKLPTLTTEVLFYAAREALRNAARYGRGAERSRPLHLCLSIQATQGLMVQIEDDGVGVQATLQGQPSSQQGLALHSTLLAVVGGTLEMTSTPGQGTRVVLRLPV